MPTARSEDFANRPGGVIHTYQKYDPANIPGPRPPETDLVTPMMNHMLSYGSARELTEEELARAVRIDPSMLSSLGPSLDALRAILEERKRKILETYETDSVQDEAKDAFHGRAKQASPPKKLKEPFKRAVRGEQLRDLEMLWYAADDERGKFARDLLQLVERLGEKYQVEELAEKYDFTGRQGLTVPEALQVKEELEKIDELLKQLDEAEQTAQIGIIDMEALSEFTEPGDMEGLNQIQQEIIQQLRDMAEQQGLEQAKGGGYELTPKAYRLFQSKLLERLFTNLEESRTGRHGGDIVGDGAVEMQRTRPYEFGDSVANMDVPQTMINAMLRERDRRPLRLRPEDIEIHQTRNSPKAATAVLMDMSGSMRYNGQYVNVKRMALGLDGLIRSEFPGDFLQFIEIYTFAKPRHVSEVAGLMPKPVTIYDPWIRLKVDMSDPAVSESMVHPHFTNIQHGLQQARRFLATKDTPNRQVFLITDGLPTAHFEAETLYLLYPPDARTEEATMREAYLCAKEGITLNIFLLQSWNQTREDIRFAYKLAENTGGRVIFTAGEDLDRFVVHDYLNHRKEIIA